MALYPIELIAELKNKARAKAKSEGTTLASVIRQFLIKYTEEKTA